MIINCDGLKSSKHSTEFHLEALWSSLKIANRKTLYISSFYRPPNSSTEILDHLDDSLNNRQHNISKIESVQRRAARKMGFKNCAIQILIGRLQPTDSTELRSRTLEARQILEASSFLISILCLSGRINWCQSEHSGGYYRHSPAEQFRQDCLYRPGHGI